MPKKNEIETNYFDDAENEGGPQNRRQLVATVIVVLALVVIGAVFAFGPMVGKKGEAPKTGDPAVTETQKGESAISESTANAAETTTLFPTANNPVDLKSSLVPPKDWTVQENQEGNRTLVVFSKPKSELDSAGNKIFTENINISNNRLSEAKAKNLAEYVNSVEDRVEKQMSNVVPTKNFEILLDDGTPAIVTAFAYTLNNVPLRSLMLFAGKGDDVYTVIGIVTDGNWNEEKDILWAAVTSFEIPASK